MLTRAAALPARAIHRTASLACRGTVRCGVTPAHFFSTHWTQQRSPILLSVFGTSASSAPPTATFSPLSSSFTTATPTPSTTTTDNPTTTSSSSSSSRPFRILGLQQVAIGSLSLPSLSSLWCDTLGLSLHSTFESQRENVTEHILTLGPHPASPFTIELDLMQPLDPTATPAPHSPPLNHIGLWVDDLRAAVQWMEGEGRVRLAPGGVRRGASGYDICFIHPKSDEKRGRRGGEGVLIELVQAPQHVIEAFEAEARRVGGGSK